MIKIQHIQSSTAEIVEEQTKDEVWSEVIQWVKWGKLPEKLETWEKSREVLVARSMFVPEMFKMREGVLMFTKAANWNRTGEVWRICLPEFLVPEVWSLCHQSNARGHRGVEGTLNQFLRVFLVLSA